MAGATTTITKAVTLLPGESFTLPPGATLIGASNPANITSTCPLPTLETLACFVAMMGGTDSDSAEDTYWEPDSRARLVGFDLSGVRTLFPSPVGGVNGCYDGPGMITQLQTALPAIIFADSGAKVEDSPLGDVGSCLSYILIQTIPSVANNLRLVFTSTGPISGGTELVEVTVKFRPYADVQADGYEDLPANPCAI